MGKTTGPEIADLLGRLYDAALKPELWPQFLEHLAGHLDGRSAALRVLDTTQPSLSHSATWNFTDEENRRYRDYFIQVDPFYRLLRRQPQIGMQLSHHAVSDREYAQSEFYSDFFRHTDRFYAAGGFVMRDSQRALLLGIQRSRQRGPFDEHDRQLLHSIAPHLKRAADLTRLLAREDALVAGSCEALDRLEIGVLLLSESGALLWANKRAEQALSGDYPLDISGGQLKACAGHEQAALRRLVSEVVAMGMGRDHPGSNALRLLGDPENHQPLVLLGVPVSRETASFWCPTERTAAILYIGSPAEQRRFCHDRLRQLFGLTPAEARVTELIANGLELKRIAQRLGSSQHTVRSQLKSIYQKTGTGRQGELVSLITATLSPLVL
ncbi:helix-turn-helix transcriptional regulator [Sedimenticola selenatireducens]|uniref:Helix-turn-helix transcriptional regulator n=1 Tax=Sedimenticola selenatireducens TaxID=191960 RepID=A0A557SH57_9GAMM|nr:helix-turn-helix transcriptional regulator [Sedimenticola selenatireducens]TVO76748.1 helix-turn-helix transcriptional regulator [Sedimenticola selenatireducens]TVT64191.1 MAG: helix-turn-helix transcriptional regulator [Sedimenticola selenatireducens]